MLGRMLAPKSPLFTLFFTLYHEGLKIQKNIIDVLVLFLSPLSIPTDTYHLNDIQIRQWKCLLISNSRYVYYVIRIFYVTSKCANVRFYWRNNGIEKKTGYKHIYFAFYILISMFINNWSQKSAACLEILSSIPLSRQM